MVTASEKLHLEGMIMRIPYGTTGLELTGT